MDGVPAPLKISPLRLVVVGAGVMGRNYLRTLGAAGIESPAVLDIDGERARAAASEFGAHVAANLRDFDAAIIAVPTASHAATTLPLLKSGIHCLVEKPFAASETECRALIAAAATADVVLQVGHIERFNPAIEALLVQGIDPTAIKFMAARRAGPASARVTDISVVADLMLHDLDIVLSLKRLPMDRIKVVGNRDHAEVELTFADGSVATLLASRTAATRTRDLLVKTHSGTYQLDYIAKRLVLPANAASPHEEILNLAGDALRAQVAHFMSSILEKSPPRVSGTQALDIMKLVWRIEAALGRSP